MKRTSRTLTFFLALVISVSLVFTVFGFADTTYRTVVVSTSGGFVPTDSFGRAITVQKDPLTGTWKTCIDNNETNYTGIVSNPYGDWYCVDGVVDFTYSGPVEENDDVWIIQEGKVDNGLNGAYEDEHYLYLVEGGKVVSKELKDTYKNGFLMTGIILAIVAAMIISSKRKKKTKKNPVKEPAVAEPIVDGNYSKTGSSIPKDYYKRPDEPVVHKKVKAKVKPKAEPRPTPTPEPQPQPQPQPKPEPVKQMPYRKKYLLTKNEHAFYKSLKPIADNLGLIVLTKVRMGDLVEPLPTWNRSEWYTNWGRVKSRHVDFALAKPSNMYVELLIELDDSSHKASNAKEVDQFKNDVYRYTGYKLLRVYNNDPTLEQKIRRKLAE